jgi:2-polyprenyl-6-methoxyphenol hydroxylase-like FAD-dependent oxidoreductase
MVLGLLLARAGIDVIVLEKHADFLRDFRGDTIHPSTLDLIDELGLLDEFLELPHQEVSRLGGVVEGVPIALADFSHSPTRCKFIAFMPQWDFLDFLAERAKRYPTFRLLFETEAKDLLINGDRVVGVQAQRGSETLVIRTDLTVGSDGRNSIIRVKAGLEVEDFGAPMDVLWFRLSRHEHDPGQALGNIQNGRIFILLSRGDYWQCGFVIAKGSFSKMRQEGLAAFHAKIAAAAGFLHDRVQEIGKWDQVQLLTVRVDRLRKWYREGLLCIGDAAHAMSPIGGVGINLAVQDAVATANRLYRRLSDRALTPRDLRAVERRRLFPTKMTQGLQLMIQRRVIRGVLEESRAPRVHGLARATARFPSLQRIPAWLVGVGFRPEHIRTPDVFGRTGRS